MGVVDAVLDAAGLVNEGERPDNRLSVRLNTCLGACSQAPVMSVDHHLEGRVSPESAARRVSALLQAEISLGTVDREDPCQLASNSLNRKRFAAGRMMQDVLGCVLALHCAARQPELNAVIAALREALQSQGLDARLSEVGCLGLCYAEPLLDVQLPGGARVFYGNFDPGGRRTRLSPPMSQGGQPVEDLALGYLASDDAGDDFVQPPGLREFGSYTR